MRGLIKLAIIAAVVYVGYSRGLPWLEERKQSKSVESEANAQTTQSSNCVGLARDASESLGRDLVPLAMPPVDRAVWANALIEVGGTLARADDACRCGTDACLEASLALSELRQMVDKFNSGVRGGVPMTNPAFYQERVDRHLDKAQRLIGR
jgi:hypothetical protein